MAITWDDLCIVCSLSTRHTETREYPNRKDRTDRTTDWSDLRSREERESRTRASPQSHSLWKPAPSCLHQIQHHQAWPWPAHESAPTGIRSDCTSMNRQTRPCPFDLR